MPLKISVFGGLGSLAHEFVTSAVVADHYISWYLHETDDVSDEFADHTEFMRITRGTDTLEHYREAVRGSDAVFVAFDAAYTNPGSWATRQAMIQTAMEKECVERILVVTTHGAGESQKCLDWSTWFMFNLNQAKHMVFGSTDMCWSLAMQFTRQEEVLMNSDLKWTIIRPGLVTVGEATGTYLASHRDVFGGTISQADVANCAVHALEENMDIGEAFSIAYSTRVA
ncbi:hypothetical protein EC988_000982 [Linderina pennispora]|nr:hypothetical protein EC988_000982 [Linderina pennispora]